MPALEPRVGFTNVCGRPKPMKTTTVRIDIARIDMLKAPDLWWSLSQELGLDEETFSRYFEYGDYGEIEIEVDETLKIVGGRFIPCGSRP